LVLPYAMMIQVIDFAVVTFVLYMLLESRVSRAHKCPVCDGWGKRAFVPGTVGDKAVTMETCHACDGDGYIWETNAPRLILQ
jgi:hypothetical protein